MTKVVCVLWTVACLSFMASGKANSQNMGFCAAWAPESSPYCSGTAPMLGFEATGKASPRFHSHFRGLFTVRGEDYRVDVTRGVRAGSDRMGATVYLASSRYPSAMPVDSMNYLGVSYDSVSKDRSIPVATVFLTKEMVNSQVSYNTGLTQGVGGFPEPIGLAFFGVGLIGIALLVHRRPVEKSVKIPKSVRASNPPIPVERS